MEQNEAQVKPKSNLNFAFDLLTALTWMPKKWSIVYDNHKMKIYFKTNTNPKIRKINITGFDFSCRAPVKVLNINSQQSGNVTRRFVDYTLAININLAKTNFKKPEPQMNVPPKAVEALARYPEKCPCVIK